MSSSGHRLEACHTQVACHTYVAKLMLPILFLVVPSLPDYMCLSLSEGQTSKEVLLLS
jgi:hypothetical protein